MRVADLIGVGFNMDVDAGKRSSILTYYTYYSECSRERARQVSSTQLAEWTAAKHVTQRGAPKNNKMRLELV
jgi:hypothetical protein